MRLAKLIFATMIPVLATPVMAWSVEGHQIVAWIAENRLHPEVQVAVQELLGGGDTNLSDGEIAGWADRIRRERRKTATYHFVNIPFDASGYDPKRDDPEGDNIIAMIGRFESVLADKSKPREERREALLFLVHLIGDLHQPLHVVDQNGDKGGNGRLIFSLDRQRAVKLHEVWDGLMVRRYVGPAGGKVGPYSDALDKQTTEAESAEWAKGSVEDWANESHRLAVEVAYAGVPADGPPPQLNQEYVDRAKSELFSRAWKALSGCDSGRHWLCCLESLPKEWVSEVEAKDELLFRSLRA